MGNEANSLRIDDEAVTYKHGERFLQGDQLFSCEQEGVDWLDERTADASDCTMSSHSPGRAIFVNNNNHHDSRTVMIERSLQTSSLVRPLETFALSEMITSEGETPSSENVFPLNNEPDKRIGRVTSSPRIVRKSRLQTKTIVGKTLNKPFLQLTADATCINSLSEESLTPSKCAVSSKMNSSLRVNTPDSSRSETTRNSRPTSQRSLSQANGFLQLLTMLKVNISRDDMSNSSNRVTQFPTTLVPPLPARVYKKNLSGDSGSSDFIRKETEKS